MKGAKLSIFSSSSSSNSNNNNNSSSSLKRNASSSSSHHNNKDVIKQSSSDRDKQQQSPSSMQSQSTSNTTRDRMKSLDANSALLSSQSTIVVVDPPIPSSNTTYAISAKTFRILELCLEGDIAAANTYSSQRIITDAIVNSINSPVDIYGNTCLHLSVSHHDLPLTLFLLLKGANPKSANRSGVTPVIMARRMGYSRIVRLLQNFGAVLPVSEQLRAAPTSQFRKLTTRRLRRNGTVTGNAAATAAVGGGGKQTVHHNMNNNTGAVGGGGGTDLDEGRERILEKRVKQISTLSGSMDQINGTTPHPPLSTSSSSSLSKSSSPQIIINNNSNRDAEKAAKAAKDAEAHTELYQKVRSALPDAHLLSLDALAYMGLLSFLPSSTNTNNTLYEHPPLPPSHTLNTCHASSILLKASYKSHLPSLHYLLTPSTIPYLSKTTDKHNIHAFVWACFHGDVPTMSYLLDTLAAPIEGAASKGIQPWQESFAPTPLTAAIFSGNPVAVEFLVKRGANVNARVGAPKGRSPVMLAAWLRDVEMVKVLVGAGAVADANVDVWLKAGWLKLKRASMGGTGFNKEQQQQQQQQQQRQSQTAAALKQNNSSQDTGTWLFSPEDWTAMAAMQRVLEKRDVVNPATVTPSSNKDSAGTAAAATTSVPAAMNSLPRQISEGSSKMQCQQGLFTENLAEHSQESILDLTAHFPEKGTELDSLCLQVFNCVLQLVLAANQSIKHHYIVIAAKAIHHSEEIIQSVEAIFKSNNQPQDLELADTQIPVISPHYNHRLSNKLGDSSLFCRSEISKRIRVRARVLAMEHHEDLAYATKIACGIWPPASAVTDMVRVAANLAKACRELVDLANTLGYYPLLDRVLELQLHPYEDSQMSQSTHVDLEDDAADPLFPRPNILTYEQYRRQNDIRNIEQLSKSYDTTTTLPLDSAASKVVENTDAALFQQLELHLKSFVVSVTDLKKVRDSQQKEKYVAAATSVCQHAKQILTEVRGFDLFREFAEMSSSSDYGNMPLLMLTQAEAKVLESTGISFGIERYPIPLMPLMESIMDEISSASGRVLDLSRLASGVWPPANAEKEMLEACFPCVLAVKKLFSIAKDVAVKIRKIWAEDSQKKEEWYRKRLQNDKVKALFQVWQGTEDEGAGNISEELTKEDIDKLKLDEAAEGLVYESGTQLFKGGKLSRIVELITSHKGLDKKLMSAFILTHHSFTTSANVLTCLIRRYERFVPPSNLTERLLKAWISRKVTPIQQNVVSVLRYWVASYYEEDFRLNEPLLGNLRKFVSATLSHDWKILAEDLTKEINSRERMSLTKDVTAKPTASLASSKPLFGVIAKPGALLRGFPPSSPADLEAFLAASPTNVLDLDPLEIAKQLTLIDYEYFVLVSPHECLDQIWGSRLAKEREAFVSKGRMDGQAAKVNGINRMVNQTNILTIWIANVILACETLKQRVQAMKFFVQIALKCREMNNFNTVTGIIAAMSLAPITRLRKTWQSLNDKHPAMYTDYERISGLVSPKGQYAHYRRELKDIKLPAIPFLGVYLTDLTFVELGNPDFLPKTSFINFEKRRKVAAIIEEIQKFQMVPYTFSLNEGIRNFLGTLKVEEPANGAGGAGGGGGGGVSDAEKKSLRVLLNEDELYAQSLVLEPREDEDEEDEEEVNLE